MNDDEDDDDAERRRQVQTSQSIEQGMAFIGNSLPPLWRRIYVNCISEGFSESQAMELLKVYVAHK